MESSSSNKPTSIIESQITETDDVSDNNDTFITDLYNTNDTLIRINPPMEVWAIGLIIAGSVIGLALGVFAVIFLVGPIRKKIFVKKAATEIESDDHPLPPPSSHNVQVTTSNPPPVLPPTPPRRTNYTPPVPTPLPRTNNTPPVPIPPPRNQVVTPAPPPRRQNMPPVPIPPRNQKPTTPNLPPPPKNWQ
jgi:hypothetical protein